MRPLPHGFPFITGGISMSMLLRKLVLGSAVMVLANVGHAQNVPAGSVAAPAPMDQPAAAPAPADQPAAAPSSGMSGTAGTTATAPTETFVKPGEPLPEGEVRASNPATDGSNDPLIQRRKDKYRAKMEYKERKHAAKSEYKQEKRDAKAEYKAEKREANQELRAADVVPPDQRNIDGRTDTSGR
jgi:hypothetical protein